MFGISNVEMICQWSNRHIWLLFVLQTVGQTEGFPIWTNDIEQDTVYHPVTVNLCIPDFCMANPVQDNIAEAIGAARIHHLEDHPSLGIEDTTMKTEGTIGEELQ